MVDYLRQSTAVTLRVGPFIDKTDAFTHLQNLNTGSPGDLLTSDIKISKNNGAFAAKNDTTEPTHDTNGFYAVTLNTTDTATLGPFILSAAKPALWLPVWERYQVIPANVYDMYNSGGLTDLADIVLLRNFALVAEGSPQGERNILNALRLLRNKASISGSTLTVTLEDDTGVAWTASVTTDAAADPITAVDPA